MLSTTARPVSYPKGNLTQVLYDAKGNPLTITDALNQVPTFTYNSQGLLLTTKDALNQTTTFTYDPLGKVEAYTTAMPTCSNAVAFSYGQSAPA